MENTPMEEPEFNYSIKYMLTDLRSGEVLDWEEDYENDKEWAKQEFEHVSNAYKTFNYSPPSIIYLKEN
tara:strand:+ start:1065 stop:1271 length:207 start_codon:yes stop_codon:yes gene_type:complete